MYIALKDGSIHRYIGSTSVRKLFINSIGQQPKRYVWLNEYSGVVGTFFEYADMHPNNFKHISYDGYNIGSHNCYICSNSEGPSGRYSMWFGGWKRLVEDRFKKVAPVEVPAIRTFDGTLVNPFDLKPEDMKPMTMIHSISTQSRFTGHAAYPYSIGQHTRNLAMVVPEDLKRAALVHDFAEAFFNDLASPVKRASPEYRKAEKAASMRIFEHFGVEEKHVEYLDKWDKGIYVNERNALFAGKLFEVGQGDDRTALNMANMPNAFNETAWRDVRDGLILLWLTLFPDYDLFTGVKQ